jgi:hypothetical protein
MGNAKLGFPRAEKVLIALIAAMLWMLLTLAWAPFLLLGILPPMSYVLDFHTLLALPMTRLPDAHLDMLVLLIVLFTVPLTLVVDSHGVLSRVCSKVLPHHQHDLGAFLTFTTVCIALVVLAISAHTQPTALICLLTMLRLEPILSYSIRKQWQSIYEVIRNLYNTAITGSWCWIKS